MARTARQAAGAQVPAAVPIAGYVADFACVEARLLIEVDGIAHDMGDRPLHDVRRDAVLSAKGWRTIRIAAKDVLSDVAGVAASLVAHAGSSRPLRPSGAPPRSGEDLEN